MSVSAPADPASPLMIAWEQFKRSEDFANSKKWAAYPEHLEGSLWNCFMVGWNAAAELREGEDGTVTTGDAA